MFATTRYRRLLCGIIAVCPSVLGQRGSDGRNPIRDFTLEEINEAILSPDASGEFTIPDPSGFDLTEEWPGTEAEGWKSRIEIKRNVPVTDDGYTTLTRISYMPPESVDIVTNDSARLVEQDRSWLPCSHLWVPSKLTALPEDVEGSCSGLLPDECEDDILSSLREGFFGDFDSEWPGPHCPLTKLPDSCRSTLGNDTRLIAFEPNIRDSLEYMNIAPWNYYEEPDIHDKGDDAFYQEALERVWILGTAWGYSRYSDFANGTDLNINATITCLRAKENDGDSAGSDEEGEEDEGIKHSVWSKWNSIAFLGLWCALYLH